MTKLLSNFGTIVVVTLGLALIVFAQETPTPAPVVIQQPTLVDPGLLDFVKVFGFGAMIFLIWWGDYRKIGKLQAMVERYEKLTKDYEKVTEECRDTMLLTMETNAKLAAAVNAELTRRNA